VFSASTPLRPASFRWSLSSSLLTLPTANFHPLLIFWWIRDTSRGDVSGMLTLHAISLKSSSPISTYLHPKLSTTNSLPSASATPSIRALQRNRLAKRPPKRISLVLPLPVVLIPTTPISPRANDPVKDDTLALPSAAPIPKNSRLSLLSVTMNLIVGLVHLV